LRQKLHGIGNVQNHNHSKLKYNSLQRKYYLTVTTTTTAAAAAAAAAAANNNNNNNHNNNNTCTKPLTWKIRRLLRK
jgi:hypothetical protein